MKNSDKTRERQRSYRKVARELRVLQRGALFEDTVTCEGRLTVINLDTVAALETYARIYDRLGGVKPARPSGVAAPQEETPNV